jgi:hypothetical protein
MSFPVSVPCIFANQSGEIPLSGLNANFAAVVNRINGICDGVNSLSNATATANHSTASRALANRFANMVIAGA